MASTKRNYWFAEPDEEDNIEADGYDSEAHEERRGARARKRRRTSNEEAEDSPRQSENGSDHEEQQENSSTGLSGATQLSRFDDIQLHPQPTKVLTNGSSQPITSKTGVIYISRIPPFMKPSTLKSYLSPFGTIGRIFLTPEDPESHRSRVRSGGNKKRSFVDGWVEFLRKRDAKVIAETLNTNIIGGKKGGFYHDDVWNIKYLKGFKWHHLTEQIANENAERAARMRQEIRQTTKENKMFVANVERAKMFENMQAKKGRKPRNDNSADEDDRVTSRADASGSHNQRFRQTSVKHKSQNDLDEGQDRSRDVRQTLSKIF
ncbi:MAG: RNA-binding ATPase activator esf2 [Alyxoria varia]|nr:MAG: RNA-binding ATPase activator esf2 [Alyxoria varia]